MKNSSDETSTVVVFLPTLKRILSSLLVLKLSSSCWRIFLCPLSFQLNCLLARRTIQTSGWRYRSPDVRSCSLEIRRSGSFLFSKWHIPNNSIANRYIRIVVHVSSSSSWFFSFQTFEISWKIFFACVRNSYAGHISNVRSYQIDIYKKFDVRMES